MATVMSQADQWPTADSDDISDAANQNWTVSIHRHSQAAQNRVHEQPQGYT